MEDNFFDGVFLGMRLRSDEILIGKTRGIKTRTLPRRVEEEQWDNEFASYIKGEPRQLVPGINSDYVSAAISDRERVHLKRIRQMLVWDNWTKVLIHRKHEKFRYH